MIPCRFLMFVITSAGCLFAQVSVQLCDPCDLTPLETTQIMVGRKCTLKISSDANDLWSGGIFLSGQNRQMGILQGRNQDPNSRDWKGSHQAPAGPMAKVYAWNDSFINGFDMYNSEYDCRPGAWFILDYQPLQPGNCTFDFYEHSISWTLPDPNILITVENIPFVDFYPDNLVDLKDFMILASHWLRADCSQPGWCDQTDINKNGAVGIEDVTVFAEYWLWGIPQTQTPVQPAPPPAEPNQPMVPPVEPNAPAPAEPNVIYGIRNAANLREITLQTGQSIHLYLDKQSSGEEVYVVHQEIVISDPNLGWIDNTEYDPNNPNTSTAEILAWPREIFFDYYGPGYIQPQGIQFIAATLVSSIQDGPLAGFDYTASGTGDVLLTPINYMEYPLAKIESILIHQVDSLAQKSLSTTEILTLAETLDAMWYSDPTIQNSTTKTEWDALVESVRTSASGGN